MNRVTLQPNVQFLYEEQLARVELDSFGCDQYQRDVDNPWECSVHVNGTASELLRRSAYVGGLDGEESVYRQLITQNYKGGRFNRTRSVNQYLTHWILPCLSLSSPMVGRWSSSRSLPAALKCSSVIVGGSTRLAWVTALSTASSPPPHNSIALDYVNNDAHALDALGVDTKALSSTMTGVRGRGAKEKLAMYNEDMQVMFREVARVLKPGAQAAFVIGDATVDGLEYTTTLQMSEWAAAVGLARVRTLPKIVYGLYSVMTDEKIIIFRKQ
jgi:hypothetical protein